MAQAQERLLFVFAPDARSELLARQRDMAAKAQSGFGDRDLKLVEVVGDGVTGSSESAASLRKRYGVAPGAFRAVLVGKDGGQKMSEPEPIAAETLFGTIDAMPMRKAEVKARQP